MIKLVISDLDGTLCNAAHGMDAVTARYLHKLQAHHCEVILATGRDRSIIEPLLKLFDLSCEVIALNGALIYDAQGTICQSRCISTAAVRKLTEAVRHIRLVNWFTSKGNYSSDEAAYRAMIKKVIPPQHLPEFEKEHGYVVFSSDLQFARLCEEECVYKVDIYEADPACIEKIRKIPGLTVNAGKNGLLEVNAQGVSKYAAAKYCCEKKKLDDYEVLAFGDSENDMEMLKRFPYGHIMRNAEEALLSKANYIAPSHTEHGVIRVIERFTNIAIGEEA